VGILLYLLKFKKKNDIHINTDENNINALKVREYIRSKENLYSKENN